MAWKIAASQPGTSAPETGNPEQTARAIPPTSSASSTRMREPSAAAESGCATGATYLLRRTQPPTTMHGPPKWGEGVAVTTLADRQAPSAPPAPVDVVRIDEPPRPRYVRRPEDLLRLVLALVLV